MTDADLHVSVAGGLDQPVALIGRDGHRFLEKHRQPGSNDLAGSRCMQLGGQEHVNGVESAAGEHLAQRAKDAGHAVPRRERAGRGRRPGRRWQRA